MALDRYRDSGYLVLMTPTPQLRWHPGGFWTTQTHLNGRPLPTTPPRPRPAKSKGRRK